MTRTVRVGTETPYDVCIGAGVLARAEGLAAAYSRVAVLTDENVGPLYLERLGALAQGEVVVVAAGEGSKSFATLEVVLESLSRAGLDRDACLVALGGGVVGDLCGLAASLYKRGVAFVQCATTLLAQVDASVGGKTAVNLPSGKNLAGTFHQPAAVLADVTTLATLPEAEFESGLGEVLKTAILSGEADLRALEEAAPALLARDAEALARTVEACVAYKARVVAEDPLEGGLRKCLNLGHTFGHGIEHIAGYGVIPHGVAVAVGIGLAFDHAAASGILEDIALDERVHALARALHLPSTIEDLEQRYGVHVSEAELRASMSTDKKNRGGETLLVLPVRAGEMKLDVRMPR